MERIRPIAVSIDRQLAEMDNMLAGLTFIAERAEEPDFAAMREAGVTMLHIIGGQVKACRRQVEVLHQVGAENAG